MPHPFGLVGLQSPPPRSREPNRGWWLAKASVTWRGWQEYRQHHAAELSLHWHRASPARMMRGHSRSSQSPIGTIGSLLRSGLSVRAAHPCRTVCHGQPAPYPRHSFRDISCRRSRTSTQLRHSQVGITDEIHRDMSERGYRSAVSIRSNCRRAAVVNGQGRGMVKLEPVDDDRHHFLSGRIDLDVRALREVRYGFRLGRREYPWLMILSALRNKVLFAPRMNVMLP